MLRTLARLLRHCWMDASDVRRAVPLALAEELRCRVHASEQRHTGEVRICVEGGLPGSYLWRHLRGRVPVGEIVRQRALMQFSRLQVWDTEYNNGVLIYVLLAEHAIELVADRGVHARVTPECWQAIVARLTQALKVGRFEDGLMQALQEVSEVLVAHFPQPEDQALVEAPGRLPDGPVLC